MSDRERLEDQAISEALGRDTAPDLSGRILGAIAADSNAVKTPKRGLSGRRFTQRVARQNRWRGAVGVSAMMVMALVAVVLYAHQREPLPNKAVEISKEAPAEEPLTPKHKAPADKPEIQPTEPDKASPVAEPAPPTEPDLPIHPKPDQRDTQPEKSDLEPEKPKPEDTPTELPEPAVPQPEEVIENPPAEGETTEAKMPADRIRERPVLASFEATENIRVSYELDGRKISLDDSTIRAGATIVSTGRKDQPAVFLWNDGALTSFFGQIQVLGSGATTKLQTTSSRLYIDCLNSDIEFEIAIGKSGKEAVINLSNSAVLVDRMLVACLTGQVRCGDSVLASGQMARASRKQEFGKAVDASRKLAGSRLLQNTPPRQLHYYNFEKDGGNDYFKGEIEETEGAGNGFAVVGTDRIGFNLPEQNHIVTPNETIRIRLRSTNCTKLSIHAFCKDQDDNYGFDVTGLKSGAWVELVIKLSAMRGRADSMRAPSTGEILTSLSVLASGTNTKIEIDTVFWARAAIAAN